MFVDRPDLEAQVTPRIKDALTAAIQRTGREEFTKLSGTDVPLLDRILNGKEEYVSIAVITLACQTNKSNGDGEIARTSISECLKGAILRLPSREKEATTPQPGTSSTPRSRRAQFLKPQKQSGRLYDPSTVRILGFGVNLFTFLVLGYFLGGLVLGPLFGFSSCIGVMATSPWLTPCSGSGIGLVLGSVIGLAYTYYYFVRRI
jgi:hypothetical protein